ncbi:MAG TPA: UDP-glucose/GDP-mannose dehydrogenase family protein [Polyangiaceae bacterium]|jgi:UDPglucose 6-dehydrogenase
MKLVVLGAGYVGLVSGTGLAELGHEVRVVDIDPERVKRLSDGVLPFYEPGLGDLIRRNERSGRLTFASAIGDDFSDADVYFICVGTPADANGDADISAVLSAAEKIAGIARKPALVAIKSTVPVGTCDEVEKKLEGARVGLEVVSNPEFLKEGDAVADFFKPERIVLGAESEAARALLRELYAPLQLSGERLVVTHRRSSELIKYASNVMLAMRVSFMNELSRLCDATGADIHAVRLGVGADKRIGRRFLYAGPGYGGSCFPKDVQALMHLGKKHDVPMRLAEATHRANQEQIEFVCKLVERALGDPRGKIVALWGLAFKPETDDVRDAPALALARFLLDRGARVVGHDPEASQTFARALPQVVISQREYDAVTGADTLVLMTEWRSYRAPNFAEIKKRMRGSIVVDARNVWRAADVQRAGLRYQGVGVNPAVPPAAGSAS